MKKEILILVGLLIASTSAIAAEEVKVWLWAEPSAAEDPRVVKVTEHHACSGKIALIKTTRIPEPDKTPFTGEKVVEFSADRTIANRWYMPVDNIVLEIEGESIVVGRGGTTTALKIGTNGELNRTPAPEFDIVNTECPDSARDEFGGSDYVRCFLYPDQATGQKRVLAYEGPCT